MMINNEEFVIESCLPYIFRCLDDNRLSGRYRNKNRRVPDRGRHRIVCSLSRKSRKRDRCSPEDTDTVPQHMPFLDPSHQALQYPAIHNECWNAIQINLSERPSSNNIHSSSGKNFSIQKSPTWPIWRLGHTSP